MKKNIMPPTYFFVLLITSIIIHFIAPIKKIIPHPYHYAGIVLIIFGLAINILTDNLFKKHKTTIKPNEKPSSFIIAGPFRLSRNPMYLGMLSILLGTSFLLKSASSFLPPLIFIIIMKTMFIPIEEENMLNQFGEKYANYKNKVRRWI